MVVAMFTDTYPPFINGVSTSCYNLVSALRKNGHRAIVVTTRYDDGPLEIKDDIIRLPGLKLKKLYGYRITALYNQKVCAFLKKNNVEIIHRHSDSTIGQFARMAAKSLNIPSVYTYHTNIEDYTYYVTHGFLDRVAKKTVRSYTMMSVRNTTEIITPSDKTKRYLRNAGFDGYINVVPTGIDFSLFEKENIDQARIEEFKKKYNINNNSYVFLVLGRLAEEKSVDVSLKCFKYFTDRHNEKDYRLLIVGSGPNLHDYEQLAIQLGIFDKTIFVGAVNANDVPIYYAMSDIYTSASLTETQGLTFNEALCARNIILARYDTNLADVLSDGYNAFFYSDPQTFMEKVEYILSLSEEERNKIKENAYISSQKFSLENFYNQIMEVYKRAKRKYR